MDAQELRNLQEAYLEVYQEQELDEARKKVKIKTNKPVEYKIADIGPGKKEYNVKTSKGWKEQVDIYDIILSHLLDEGYAETVETAEAIMVNMSEEWRQSIVEVSEEDKQRLLRYDVRYYQKHGGMPADPEKRRELRDAARRLRPA